MAVSPLLLAATTNAITSIVDNQVIPGLRKVVSSVTLSYNLNIEPLGKHFEGYLSRSYEKLSILNTLVFRNQQKRLRDLYIPLSLVREGVKNPTKDDVIIINNYPREFMSESRRLLITDTAGMGKSTLTKIMFLSAIDQQAGIPFYVELRRLSKNHTLLQEIREQLNSLTKEFSDDLMRRFFQSGGFIFFLDGYDEIPLSEKGAVTDDIKSFIEKAPDNFFILTSRFEQALSGFGDFLSMRICPLTKKEAFSLLQKYDSEGETAIRLIDKINSLPKGRITEFLTNPLLVSLLYIGFNYKPEIPLKIHLFYDQVFEAYFNTHDLSKDGHFIHEKKSGLDMADFSKVLRSIGFICLTKNRLDYERADFLGIIESAGKLSCVTFKSAEDLMYDLLHSVPLFCQDGVSYKWVHKSMQEYYAADYINRDSGAKKELILDRISVSPELNNYMNVLEFFSDLDYRMFSLKFVLPLLNDFISYIDRPIVIQDEDMKIRVRRRRQMTYNRDTYLYLFTDVESRMAVSDVFQLLYKKVNAHIPAGCTRQSVISRQGPNLKGVLYVIGRNGKLMDLIQRRYPEIVKKSNLVSSFCSENVSAGNVIHLTDNLGIEDANVYDDLDAFAVAMDRVYWDYDSVKRTIESISNTLSENENVFNDLITL